MLLSKSKIASTSNYTVHELDILAILEALLRWEDKLLGYKIHVIMDHKVLEFFKTQQTLMVHQHQWMDYLSKFNFDINYVKGELNQGSRLFITLL